MFFENEYTSPYASYDYKKPYNLLYLLEDLKKLKRHLYRLASVNHTEFSELSLIELDELHAFISCLIELIDTGIDASLLMKAVPKEKLLSEVEKPDSRFYARDLKTEKDFLNHWIKTLIQSINKALEPNTHQRALIKEVVGLLKGLKKKDFHTQSAIVFLSSLGDDKSRPNKALIAVESRLDLLRKKHWIDHDFSKALKKTLTSMCRGLAKIERAEFNTLQAYDVVTGDSKGDCGGHVRRWAESILAFQGVRFESDSDIDYPSHQTMPSEWVEYLLEEREGLKVAYDRQYNQSFQKEDNFNLVHKRLTRRYYMGQSSLKDASIVAESLLAKMNEYFNHPLELTVWNSSFGHALGCYMGETYREGQKDLVIRFYDPNCAEFTFRGPDANTRFKKWYTCYANEHFSGYDTFQLKTYLSKEDKRHGDTWSGVGRTLLTGPKYGLNIGLLSPYFAVRNAWNWLSKKSSHAVEAIQKYDINESDNGANMTFRMR